MGLFMRAGVGRLLPGRPCVCVFVRRGGGACADRPRLRPRRLPRAPELGKRAASGEASRSGGHPLALETRPHRRTASSPDDGGDGRGGACGRDAALTRTAPAPPQRPRGPTEPRRHRPRAHGVSSAGAGADRAKAEPLPTHDARGDDSPPPRSGRGVHRRRRGAQRSRRAPRSAPAPPPGPLAAGSRSGRRVARRERQCAIRPPPVPREPVG